MIIRLLRFFVIGIFIVGFGVRATAQVTVTPATGGTSIFADKASNASSPSYTTLGNIVITEVANGDIPATGNNKTIILTAPAGWQFNTGATVTATFAAGGDITAASVVVTNTSTITVKISVNTIAHLDVLTISGIQIQATDGANALAANVFITRTGGTLGTINGITNGVSGTGTSLGPLSQALGTLSQLVVTLPGQTFTDGTTLAGSGNTGTVTAQTAGTSFNITHLTATDQFYNVITSYSGAETISYSGPNNAPGGGNPVYTTAVSFTSGIATTTLSTTLKAAETTTITATDGSVPGITSSNLTVNAGALNNFLVEAAGGGNIGTESTGVAFSIMITARDANDNAVTSYNTSGALTTNATSISPTTTGTGYVNGVLTLSVTLTGANSSRTITVTQGGATGTSNAFLLNTIKTATTSGNWSTAGTWSPSGVPLSTDYVIINPGVTVTVTGNTTIASISFDSTSATTSTLTINAGKSLDVSGAISLRANSGNNTSALLTGSGTLNCDSIVVGGDVFAGGKNTTTLTTSVATLNVTGDIDEGSYDQSNGHYNQALFTISSGVVTIGGTVNMTSVGANHGPGQDPVLTLSGGTLVLTGSNPINTNGNGTVVLNNTGTTVNYAGTGNQTVYPTVYNTLDLSGSGTKSITSGTGVNSTIDILGTAKADIATSVTLTVTNLSLGGSPESVGYWGGVSPPADATRVNTTFFSTANSGDVHVTANVRVMPTFSGLTASQTICDGTAFTLTGTVSSGSTVPSTSETIYATINGNSESGTIGGSPGFFSISFPANALLTPGSSYAINYFYGGDASLTAIENTVNTLTVTPLSVGGTSSAATSPVCSGSTTSITLVTDTGTAFQWQQSTTGLSGWSNISGASSESYTTAALTSTTFYRAVVTNGICPADTSSSSSVVIATPYTVTGGGPDNSCESGTPAAITLLGSSVGNGATTGAWSITSGSGSLSSTSQTSSPNAVTFTPSSNTVQTVTLQLLTNAPGVCPAASATRTVNIFPVGEWMGTSSVNWNDAANWCSGVPGTGTDVVIPSGTSFSPIISTTANCHNLTINSGATLTLNTGADFSLYGNLTRNGTYTQNAGTLELVGGSNQSIPAITVTNIIINNTGSGVTLAGNIKIGGTATFTKGVITTGADTVIITNTGGTAVVSGSGNTNYVNSWVNGYLKRNYTTGSASYDFPIGNATKACLATLNSHSLTGISYFTAYFSGTATGGNNINSRLSAWETGIGGTPETPYTSINTGGSWKIEPNAQPTGGTSYDISVYFNGFTTLADNEFGILKRAVTSTDYADFKPGGGTLNATNGLGRTVAGGYALRLNLTSFSEFAIGQSGAVLPIQLVSFTAEKCNNDLNALLKWNTASELNNDHFDVQVAATTSADASLTFTTIGQVKGAGTSDVAHNYNFTDLTAGKLGNRYYRLGQVDVDGSINYSNIVALNFDGSTLVTNNLYPNPVSDALNYSITVSDNMSVTISITNITGQEIFMEQTTIASGLNKLSLDVSQLKPGVYFFNLSDGKSLSNHTRFEKF